MRASKYTLQLDWEQVNLIIVTELKQYYDWISSETDPPEKENKKKTAKLRKAFKTVLDFYGVKV